MNFRFTLTENDYVEAQREFVKASGSQHKVLRGLQIFGAILIAAGVINLAAKPHSLLPGLPSLIVGLLWLALPWYSSLRWRQEFHRHPNLKNEFEFLVSDAGLEMKSAVGTSQIAWAAFSRYLENRNFFLLFEGASVFRIVPKRALASGDVDSFRKILAAKIQPKT